MRAADVAGKAELSAASAGSRSGLEFSIGCPCNLHQPATVLLSPSFFRDSLPLPSSLSSVSDPCLDSPCPPPLPPLSPLPPSNDTIPHQSLGILGNPYIQHSFHDHPVRPALRAVGPADVIGCSLGAHARARPGGGSGIRLLISRGREAPLLSLRGAVGSGGRLVCS